MEDGTEKKLAQIDLDYRKELDAIKKQRKDWETEQGGKLTDKQEEKLGTWASNAAKKEKAILIQQVKPNLKPTKKHGRSISLSSATTRKSAKILFRSTMTR